MPGAPAGRCAKVPPAAVGWPRGLTNSPPIQCSTTIRANSSGWCGGYPQRQALCCTAAWGKCPIRGAQSAPSLSFGSAIQREMRICPNSAAPIGGRNRTRARQAGPHACIRRVGIARATTITTREFAQTEPASPPRYPQDASRGLLEYVSCKTFRYCKAASRKRPSIAPFPVLALMTRGFAKQNPCEESMP